MEKTKKEVVKRIRNKIVTGDLEKTHNLQQDRVEIVRVVQGLSAQVELLSKNEQEFFEKLIEEIKEIPKSAHDLRMKEQKVLDGLVETAAALKIAIEKETDPEKKKKLQEGLEAVQEKGKKWKEEIDIRPRSLKETLSMRYAGLKPRDVRKEGFRGAFKKEAKNLYGKIFNPAEMSTEQTFDDTVNTKVAEMKAEQLEKKEEQVEKGDLNKTGKEAINNAESGIMKALLTEVSVIRKLVDGSIKMTKDGKYIDTKTGQVKSKEDVRTAGEGLYTKEELGQSLGMTKSQIKKGSLSDIQRASAHEGIISVESAALNAPQSDESKKVQNAGEEAADKAIAGTDAPTEVTTADVAEKLDKIAELLEKGVPEGQGPAIQIPTPRANIASRFARGARSAGRSALGLGRTAISAGMTGVGAASTAAVAGTAVAGLGAGLAIGDQFNTSVEEGGTGTLRDWWRNTTLGGLRNESIAERESRESSATNSDLVARQRGFSSFREMQAENRRRASEQQNISSMQRQSGTVLDELAPTPTPQQPAQPPVITNITNNNAPPATPVPEPMPPVKTTDNSFIRYQDRRMNRVL